MHEKSMLRIAVGYENFGPYHLARLEALAARCKLLAVEFAKSSATYGWAPTSKYSFDGVVLEEGTGKPDFSKTVRLLEQSLSAFAPDVVFVPGWSDRVALAMLRWCRKSSVPAVLMSDSQEIDEPRRLVKEFIKSQIISKFDGALVAGDRHLAYLQKLGFRDNPVLQPYDVVDNEHFSPTVKDVPRKYFLSCARLVEKKNLSTLLLAYRQFLDMQEGSDTYAPDLVIVGEGPLRGALSTQAAMLGLSDKLFMPGFIDYAKLPDFYHSARVFVLSSTTEQWGLVVNEAMAAGCPVLVSERAGCVPELVRNGLNGFTFDPDNPEQLAESLMSFHLSPERIKIFGKQSREIISSYGLREHVDAVLEIASLVKSAPCRRGSWMGELFMQALLKRTQRGTK